jgi:DNA modification methylase
MADWLNQTHVGDCRELLRQMAADGVRVQTCITSPPYYALRDYGTAQWIGGDVSCAHERQLGGYKKSTLDQWKNGLDEETISAKVIHSSRLCYRSVCGKCGAHRIDQQIGLEATPTEYIGQLVSVFRMVRDLLKDDGTLWLNLGDCYASSGTPGATNLTALGDRYAGGGHKHDELQKPRRTLDARLKAKDLSGIPWRVALALQSDGWYLRSDIVEEVELYCPCGCGYLLEERIWRWSQDREVIWKKPNPMPESVRDRPTRSHEYIFLLSKSPMYYYDGESIKEPAEFGVPNSPQSIASPYGQGFTRRTRTVGLGANSRASKAVPNVSTARKELRSDIESRHRSPIEGGQSLQIAPNGMRNKRSVWTVATTPFDGAHFAVFPRRLIEPCVIAGSRPGDTVLDPFAGSGTTRQVAQAMGRHFIGCELNPAYISLDEARQTTIGLPL